MLTHKNKGLFLFRPSFSFILCVIDSLGKNEIEPSFYPSFILVEHLIAKTQIYIIKI